MPSSCTTPVAADYELYGGAGPNDENGFPTVIHATGTCNSYCGSHASDW